METTRGRGGGRGRGGARAPKGGQSATPLAAQLRQMQRLDEPKELAILRKFKDLGATRVQSVYGQTGLLSQEIFVPREIASRKYNDVSASGGYITLLDAEECLGEVRLRQERDRMVARRQERLPEARARLSIGQLTDEERRILRLSQKDFQSFRASQGGNAGTAVAVPTAAGTPAVATPQASTRPVLGPGRPPSGAGSNGGRA